MKIFCGPATRQVNFSISADAARWNSIACPAAISLFGGILSDQICQNSKTLLSGSSKKGITALAEASFPRAELGGYSTLTTAASIALTY